MYSEKNIKIIAMNDFCLQNRYSHQSFLFMVLCVTAIVNIVAVLILDLLYSIFGANYISSQSNGSLKETGCSLYKKKRKRHEIYKNHK